VAKINAKHLNGKPSLFISVHSRSFAVTQNPIDDCIGLFGGGDADDG
jgi:hypothetical protein